MSNETELIIGERKKLLPYLPTIWSHCDNTFVALLQL